MPPHLSISGYYPSGFPLKNCVQTRQDSGKICLGLSSVLKKELKTKRCFENVQKHKHLKKVQNFQDHLNLKSSFIVLLILNIFNAIMGQSHATVDIAKEIMHNTCS